MKKTTSGFTIVELLIVIVVIAILAAITIVAFNGIQNRSYDSAIQSDLAAVARKMDLYSAENNDLYPVTGAALESLGLRISRSAYALDPTVTRNAIYCTMPTPTIYGFLSKSKSGNAFIIRSSDKTPKPFTDAWSSGATATTLCTNAGYSSTQAAGYWTGQTPNWNIWTGS